MRILLLLIAVLFVAADWPRPPAKDTPTAKVWPKPQARDYPVPVAHTEEVMSNEPAERKATPADLQLSGVHVTVAEEPAPPPPVRYQPRQLEYLDGAPCRS